MRLDLFTVRHILDLYLDLCNLQHGLLLILDKLVRLIVRSGCKLAHRRLLFRYYKVAMLFVSCRCICPYFGSLCHLLGGMLLQALRCAATSTLRVL